jgi:hypothetical protein
MNRANERIPQVNPEWTRYDQQHEPIHPLIPPIINEFYKNNVSKGTESEMLRKTNPSATMLFLDADIGDVVRKAVDGLGSLYTFHEPDLVRPLLGGNNTLRKMLVTIHSKIRKEFPSEKITLGVFSDSPRSGERDVVVSVATSLTVDEAIERLDKVENVRWDKDSKDPYVNICVELDYP